MYIYYQSIPGASKFLIVSLCMVRSQTFAFPFKILTILSQRSASTLCKTCLPQSLSASAWPVLSPRPLQANYLPGSGKTTFMQRLNVHLHTQRNPPYVLNLDPAVLNLPYEANIDIRDSINYKEVMKQYTHTV